VALVTTVTQGEAEAVAALQRATWQLTRVASQLKPAFDSLPRMPKGSDRSATTSSGSIRQLDHRCT
jgi:hypothetical protein